MIALVNRNLKIQNKYRKINLKISNCKLSFQKVNFKSYNGLFQRPTQSLLSHIQIVSVIESINFFHDNFNLPWSLSIALTTSLIRLIQIPTYFLIKNLNIKKVIPFKNYFRKWSHKFIYNDFYIDMKRHKINDHEKQKLIKYYDMNLIISYIPQLILMFNYFRALYSMSINSHLYPGLSQDIGIINLATYDAYFLFPVIMIINNYFLIKKIEHPWLINYQKNNLKLLYISFIFGIFSLIWPKCYCISLISYSVTHILIKIISNKIDSRQGSYLSYSSHVERIYRKKVENNLK
jgi:hypothetical protein